ncbi:hypothetical protein MBRA1_003875 [Malassezia brasiliensis]|uniref:C2H2-type domain-containing protein n=1 Tax=Malassezia brasiliensis TaxID=1821822 RepID=A0AAF0E0C2_9BASI|nr:hypothetical protein MBRA1_003875 [Malassezia brasiliensis]
MDTVVWNWAAQDPRLAYSAPHSAPWSAGQDGYLASTLAHYGPSNAPAALRSPAPDDSLRASATSTPSPHSPSPSLMHTDALARQDAPASWMPSTILQPPLGTDLGPAPQGHVETPMISLRAASPTASSKDADAAALMGLLGTSPRMYAPPSTAPPAPPAPQGAPPLGLGAPKAASTSPVAPPATLGQADIRRRDSAQLRHFLKLDVDMGFVSDEKNESPTLLQPTSGWKKRRSVSDVGPRTPSMLGGALDAPIISPMDDMAFLLPDVPMPAAREAPRTDTHDPALHFASLNLHVVDDAAPPAAQRPAALAAPSGQAPSAPALAAPSGHAPSASAPDVLAATGGTPLSASPTSPVTLDPTLIQHTPMLPFHAALASPALGASDAPDAPAHTGPIRPRGGARTARSTSPYETPAPSWTPDDEDTRTRMAQWRFPLAGDAPNASLHPLDAYTRAGLDEARMPSAAHARARRHLRAAVSEDWARAHGAPRASWAAPPSDASRADHVEPLRRAPSPDAALWAAAQASQQLLHAQREGAASPTPSDAAQSSRSSAPQLSPGSSTSASSPEGRPPVQTAAQTRTPVVTTSAAQAASALRRKTKALFTCPFPDCGSTFTRQYNLRGHMRSHMDQRPFKCDWPGCGRSFARTHDCKRHHNLHLNIKPYACESCGKTFARLDALNRHHKSEAGSCGAQSDAHDSSGTPA